jgi:hypothetical protein
LPGRHKALGFSPSTEKEKEDFRYVGTNRLLIVGNEN